MKRIVQTEDAPPAIGPYSQAVQIGNFLFVSGQIPLHPQTSTVVGPSIQEQTEQVLKNLESILKSVEFGLQDVIKCTIFLKDLGDFEAVNAIYSRYFSISPPARACVEVSRLPKDVLIEIEAIAYRS
ncbi:MAG: RidA family protein [Planctomycetota bacterium]|nr:MAG: RidA family protein [Planctomycetota bacterium]